MSVTEAEENGTEKMVQVSGAYVMLSGTDFFWYQIQRQMYI